MKTVGDIRRENLALLIKEFKTLNALAVAGGTTSVYLSQVRNQSVDKKTGRPRQMGDEIARRLEAACTPPKPPGWMDHEHDSLTEQLPLAAFGAAPPPPPPDFADPPREVTDSGWDLLDDLKNMPDAERQAFKAQIHQRAEMYRTFMRETLSRAKAEAGSNAETTPNARGPR